MEAGWVSNCKAAYTPKRYCYHYEGHLSLVVIILCVNCHVYPLDTVFKRYFEIFNDVGFGIAANPSQEILGLVEMGSN